MSANEFLLEISTIFNDGRSKRNEIMRSHFFDMQGATAHRRFRQLFGIPPWICSKIWTFLAARNALPPNAKPRHLLCALLFLKVYGTEEVHSAFMGY